MVWEAMASEVDWVPLRKAQHRAPCVIYIKGSLSTSVHCARLLLLLSGHTQSSQFSWVLWKLSLKYICLARTISYGSSFFPLFMARAPHAWYMRQRKTRFITYGTDRALGYKSYLFIILNGFSIIIIIIIILAQMQLRMGNSDIKWNIQATPLCSLYFVSCH